MLDQSRFRLLTGSDTFECFTKGDFETVRDIMEARLLDALCMEAAPEGDSLSLWEQLLGDALEVSVLVQQDDGIESENMRNYSYKFRDYANTWSMLQQKDGDLLNKFNVCETGIVFQRDLASHIYGHSYPCGGCGTCYECV